VLLIGESTSGMCGITVRKKSSYLDSRWRIGFVHIYPGRLEPSGPLSPPVDAT